MLSWNYLEMFGVLEHNSNVIDKNKKINKDSARGYFSIYNVDM